MLYALLGVAIGVLLPNQSAVNNRLRASVSTPWVMAVISFLVGTICLAVLTWATVGTVSFDATLFITQPWWLWIGGLVGVVGMTTTVLLLPILGALYSTALNLTAQVITTMVIDHFGLFGVDVYRATSWRLTGALVVVGAALLAVLAGRARPQRQGAPSPGWYVIGIAVGVCFGGSS
ncbi:MAG: DMT family transporter [Micrococcaceae bacterium]|nr:DMT family transporter [Micrococcaceae bacterium]